MRIDRQTVAAARQFDTALAARLSDGTVSDVDMQAAETLYRNMANNPPPANLNAWGMPQQSPYAVQKWHQNVAQAQFIYSQVSNAYQRQHPQVTAMETQKDLMNPSGTGGWNANRYPPQYPVQYPQQYPTQYPQYPTQYPQQRQGTAAAIGSVLLAVAAFEAIRRMGH